MSHKKGKQKSKKVQGGAPKQVLHQVENGVGTVIIQGPLGTPATGAAPYIPTETAQAHKAQAQNASQQLAPGAEAYLRRDIFKITATFGVLILALIALVVLDSQSDIVHEAGRQLAVFAKLR